MSRLSSLVTTPVSDRIKLFGEQKQTKKMPEQGPKVRDTSRGLDTPKLRPVPRQQFTIKEPPAAVRANLNPKLSSARGQQQEAAKAELKTSRSETPASKAETPRVTRVRSTSSAR